jgi:hypothetical protein
LTDRWSRHSYDAGATKITVSLRRALFAALCGSWDWVLAARLAPAKRVRVTDDVDRISPQACADACGEDVRGKTPTAMR